MRRRPFDRPGTGFRSAGRAARGGLAGASDLPCRCPRTGSWARAASRLAVLAVAAACAEPAADGAPAPAAPETTAVPSAAAWTVSIAPRPEDVSSLDGIVAAFYDVVSGPAGQPRDWARDSTLYLPGVRFVIVDEGQAGGVARVTDHATFAAGAAGLERDGFYEREIHRVTQNVGEHVAYLLSTYEWRTTPDGPVGGRGVNSIALFHDGARWWITQAMWSEETPANPIPPALLPEAGGGAAPR